MAPLLAIALTAGIALIAYAVATSEPTDPGAVTLVIFGAGVTAFAVAAIAMQYSPLRRSRRGPRREASLRRGVLVGLGIATLAFLRVVDALSLVTAAFVVIVLAALEGALSARG